MPAQGNNQLNISIDLNQKNEFKRWCKINRTTMSEALLKFIELCLADEDYPFIQSLILEKEEDYIPQDKVENAIKRIFESEFLPNLEKQIKQIEAKSDGESNLTQYRNELVGELNEKFNRRLVLIENRLRTLETFDNNLNSDDFIPKSEKVISTREQASVSAEDIYQKVTTQIPHPNVLNEEEEAALSVLLREEKASDTNEDITYLTLEEAYLLAKERGCNCKSKGAFSKRFQQDSTAIISGIARDASRVAVGQRIKAYYSVEQSIAPFPDKLSLQEAYDIAKENGYKGVKKSFRDLLYSHREEPGYAAYGITRIKKEGTNSYYYRKTNKT